MASDSRNDNDERLSADGYSDESTSASHDLTRRLLQDDSDPERFNEKSGQRSRPPWTAWDQSCLVLFASAIAFIGSILWYAYHSSTAATDAACEKKMWAFSPMQQVMEFEWRQNDFNDAPWEYYGEPTERRRELWERIYDGMANRTCSHASWWEC
jgi:hypothetical protein